jgi:hypothetical protein
MAGTVEGVTPLDMLAELRDDNKQLVAKMRETHELLRATRRRGHDKFAGSVDRRGSAARVVPVRGEPIRRDGVIMAARDLAPGVL